MAMLKIAAQHIPKGYWTWFHRAGLCKIVSVEPQKCGKVIIKASNVTKLVVQKDQLVPLVKNLRRFLDC